MKPRPISSLRVIPIRPNRTAPNLHCRRNLHTHTHRTAIETTLSCQQWHEQSRPSALGIFYASRLNLRHASSAATAVKHKSHLPPSPAPAKPSKHTTSSTAVSPIPKARAKLNPPPETYAPPLNVPPRKAGQNYASYLWYAGKAYIAFYKAGISNVRATARIAKTLRAKHARAKGKEGEEVLTRAEWQIVRRSRKDMLRLPAFGFLVLLMGEWLPLVALYITPLIPEPCRIPAQNQRTLYKLEIRRKERQRRIGIDAARLIGRDRKIGVGQTAGDVHPQTMRLEEVDKLDLFSLLTLSSKLDAHSRIWDWLFLTPPKGLLRWDVGRRLAYLQKDDKLIGRDGGWQALEGKEIQRACVERGIDVLGRSEADLRKELAGWFKK